MKKLSEVLNEYVVITTQRIINNNNNLYIVPRQKIYNRINVSEIFDSSEYEKNTKCNVFSFYKNDEEVNIINVDGFENEFDYVDEELNNNIIEEYYNYINNPIDDDDDEKAFIKLHFQDCIIIQVNC